MNKNRTEPLSSLESSIAFYERNFIKLIRLRFGIVIHHHQTNELYKTILDACQIFHCSVDNYLQMLTDYPDDDPLLKHLIAGITVNETYFFRDKHQMQLLQETLLPQLIQSKRVRKDRSLRIWSAGCATGEEIYTVGMMLVELLPDISAWRLQLLGTDLNTGSLQKAMQAHYTEWSMRSISSYFKQQYFTHENNKYTLLEKIRDVVGFSYLNMNDDTYPSLVNGTNAQDLILCRNVLIYFDNARAGRLMKKLNNSLVPGGLLLLGASDPILTVDTDLISHHRFGTLFSRPTLDGTPALPVLAATEKIIKKSVLVSVTEPRASASVSLAETLPHGRGSVTPTEMTGVKKSVVLPDAKKIQQLLNESRWQEALDAIHLVETKGKIDSVLLNLKAMAYANLGQLEQSLQACLDSLSLDITNKYTYFTYALTLTELNRLIEAEEAFRKTLFLDRNFVMGHFQLGLLLLRKREYDMGMKSLTNALAIAKGQQPSEPVSGYQGLNYGQLSDLFKQEIELYTYSKGE